MSAPQDTPMSENDPWKRLVALVAHLTPNTEDGARRSMAVLDAMEAQFAARAAEATQHQQEIAAKDETIRQGDREIDACKQEIARLTQEPFRLAQELSAARARIAAVEAERDNLKNRIIDLGARVVMADEERTEAATLRAERDRLKAALSTAAFALDLAGFRRDRDAAYAALTPQGQSTDGETR